MRWIDINCDMGEGFDNDEALMPYVSSVNIACGYHAGDAATMRKTIALAMQHGVAIGAHPGFNDKENFGRKNIQLTPREVYDITSYQINTLMDAVKEAGTKLTHVKPHGALYNMAAKDAALAKAIAEATKAIDPSLMLVGLSGSCFVHEAKAAGLKALNEVFADRTYIDDRSLTPRTAPNALIEDEQEMLAQALQMINQQTVTTISGKSIPIIADTICIHGDGTNALRFAKALYALVHKERRFL